MGGEVPILGRDPEQHTVRHLVASARNGRGGALLLAGDPGIGKTTLLRATTSATAGMRLLRVDGFEAESTIPFAALHRLTIPLRDHLGSLPERQQGALRVAAGVSEGPPPDRFLVAMGVLGLVAAAGEVKPVLCAVDDAHLLDPESLDVLAFVARRLEAESVALVFAGRDTSILKPQPSRVALATHMAGVPTLRLEGLRIEDAVRLLMSSLPEEIDLVVARQVAVATGGNPLALVDLAGDLTARQLAESTFAAEPLPVGHHLDAFYLRRVRHLSADLQTWLLVAAADSTGNLDLIGVAARELDLPDDPVDAAEATGLVEVRNGVSFRHPLVRAAAYNAARGAERRKIHRALAVASDALGLVELEAWHAAKATLGTDAAVADRLERVADAAGRRGGFSSRANVLAQASALTPPGGPRYARLVAAAEAALAAGAAHVAAGFLDDVDEDELEPLVMGRMIMVRASLALFLADPALTRAGAQMLAAAEAFHGHDSVLEQNALIRAFEFTLPAERLVEGLTLAELGGRLRKGAELSDGVAATVLRGLSAHILLPYAEAVPMMRAAVRALSRLPARELLQYGSTSVALTTALWDLAGRRALLEATAAAAREAGSLQLLDNVLWVMSLAELSGGTPRASHAYIEQVRELRRAIGYDAENVVNVAYLAWADAPRTQVEQISRGAAAMGFGGVESAGEAALAARDLAEGSYEQAYARLKPLVEDPFLQTTPLELPDFVEAAVRSGRRAEALDHVRRLEHLASLNGSAWNRGVAQRSRALVEEEPERHFRASLESLTETGADVETGRAHLLFGEWLRRGRRRRLAREHLRRAVELFERSEAPAFGQRARHELEASGEAMQQRGSSAGSALTTQQLSVARLAASGHTNAEIGSTMFLSVNTVDYHLRKVFQTLGISSRRQLADRLGEQG